MNISELIMASARHTSLLIEVLHYKHGKDFKVSAEEIVKAGAEASTTIALQEEKKSNAVTTSDIINLILKDIFASIESGEKCEKCNKSDDCEVKDTIADKNKSKEGKEGKKESINDLIDRKLRELNKNKKS